MAHQRFTITGMTCASCAHHVEEAASGVPGVDSAAVNLLTSTMEVSYPQHLHLQDQIVRAIESAGYKAEVAKESLDVSSTSAAQHQPVQQRFVIFTNNSALVQLILSCMIGIPLVFLAMAPMLHFPGLTHLTREGFIIISLAQLILALLLVVVNRSYFLKGFSALFHLRPSMDSLIAVGAGAALVYGIFEFVQLLSLPHFASAVEAFHHESFDSLAMILILVDVGKYIENWAKHKTTQALDLLTQLSTDTATVLREGKEIVIAQSELRLNDMIVVKTGESIPADGVVVKGQGTVDESSITGEPIPVDKAVGSTIIAGTILLSGWILICAISIGSQTTLAKIIAMVEKASASKTPIQRIADAISRIFVPLVMLIAVGTLIVLLSLTHDLSLALTHALSVLVISCPCALGLATPTAIMVATGRFAQHGILVRSAESIEQLARIDTVVFDKTGTLTQGQPQVSAIVFAAEVDELSLMQKLYALEQKSEHVLAKAISNYAQQRLNNLRSAHISVDNQQLPAGHPSHCSQLSHTSQSLHSTQFSKPLQSSQSSQFLQLSDFSDISDIQVEEFHQHLGSGVSAIIDGQQVLCGNLSMLRAHHIDIKQATALTNRLATVSDEDSTSDTMLYVVQGSQVLAVLVLSDCVKSTSVRAVQLLHKSNIRTVLLTGDRQSSAQTVADSLGIDTVISEVLPDRKGEVINELTQEHTVAMVGDGVNDAAALAYADVGIALGSGTDIAVATSDMVFMRNDPVDVVNAVNFSRATLRNIRQNIVWAFAYNLLSIPLAMGLFAPLGLSVNPVISTAAMGLSSIIVVFNALRLRSPRFRFVQ